MDKYIVLSSLTVAIMSLGMAVIIWLRCRRMKREHDRILMRRIREQDILKLEMEHIRIEKETLEKLLETKVNTNDKNKI